MHFWWYVKIKGVLFFTIQLTTCYYSVNMLLSIIILLNDCTWMIKTKSRSIERKPTYISRKKGRIYFKYKLISKSEIKFYVVTDSSFCCRPINTAVCIHLVVIIAAMGCIRWIRLPLRLPIQTSKKLIMCLNFIIFGLTIFLYNIHRISKKEKLWKTYLFIFVNINIRIRILLSLLINIGILFVIYFL